MAFGRRHDARGADSKNETRPRFSATELPTRRIEEDSEIAPAVALFNALRAKETERENQIAILQATDYLATRAKDDNSQNVVATRDRIRALKATTPAPVAVASPEAKYPPEIERALPILRGDTAKASAMPTIKELRADVEIIHAALIVQAEIVERLKSQANYEMAEALRATHLAKTVAIYLAAETLAVKLAEERQFFAALIDLGYSPRTDIFVTPALPSAFGIGHPTDHNSQLFAFRRYLESRGVVL